MKNIDNNETFKEPEISQVIKGHITKIINADLYEMSDGKNSYLIRLWNCNIPEKKELFGQKVNSFLEKIILNRKIIFNLINVDDNQRNIGKVLLLEPNNKTQDIALYLIYKGLAFTNSTLIDDPYYKIQRDSEYHNRGAWKIDSIKKPFNKNQPKKISAIEKNKNKI